MRGPLIGGKDLQLPFDKEASSRRGLRGVPRGRRVSYFLEKKTKEKMEV